jgi:hypothetical protein
LLQASASLLRGGSRHALLRRCGAAQVLSSPVPYFATALGAVGQPLSEDHQRSEDGEEQERRIAQYQGHRDSRKERQQHRDEGQAGPVTLAGRGRKDDLHFRRWRHEPRCSVDLDVPGTVGGHGGGDLRRRREHHHRTPQAQGTAGA